MDGMQGQPMIGKMKMFFRGFAVLIIPLTASFPKVLCHLCLLCHIFKYLVSNSQVVVMEEIYLAVKFYYSLTLGMDITHVMK